MKSFISTTLIALTAASWGIPGQAASDHGAHAATHAPAATPLPLADGVVKKIDLVGQKVTLAHGALPNGMPAMTMVYRVKEAAWLGQMKPGQKIRFAADSVGGAMTLLRFEPAP